MIEIGELLVIRLEMVVDDDAGSIAVAQKYRDITAFFSGNIMGQGGA